MQGKVWDGAAGVPGPVDRESFSDQQVRHRRRSVRFTVLSAVAIGLMGIPLAAVVTPILAALAVVLLDLVNLVVDTPDLLRPLAESDVSTEDLTPAQWAVVAVALVVPGSVAMLLAWVGVRRVLGRAGSGTALLALGAREPSGDLEERQLRNVVEEMATAAGIPAPRVMVLDAEMPNAVAVGGSIEDATIVVTTGLLTSLDRAETQGVIGHLVGSIGNGDLRIGTTLGSVFQTLGLVETVLRSPGERAPRRTLRRLVRSAFRRPGADDTAALAALLTRAGTEVEVENEPEPGPLKAILTVPFVTAGMSFAMTRLLFGFAVVNPLLRRAWRARKRLADATAVQLTREPGALARALTTLGARGGLVPGTAWAAYLFVVGPEVQAKDDPDTVTFNAPVGSRLDRLAAMGADVEHASRRSGGLRVLPVVLTSPCWLPLYVLFLGCSIVLTLVSLAIDMLFLAPMVALLHVLLR